MIPVQTIVPAALAAIIRKAPLTEEKVGFAWRIAVGPAVAGATAVALDCMTLCVTARDRAWQREIERSAATIRTRLDDLLGSGVVRFVNVTVAATAEPRRAVPRHGTGPAAAGPARKTPPSAGGSDTARRRR
jgi:hypothetical protein